MIRCRGLLAAVLLTATACSRGGSYTLYRGSPLDNAGVPPGQSPMRIHVATFDAADGEGYNSENCRSVAALMEAQPGVTVKYWCEKGTYQE